MKIRKKQNQEALVIVPFDICGFKAGYRISVLNFANVLMTHIEHLEDDLEDSKHEIERLNRTLDAIRSDIDAFYSEEWKA